MKRIRSVLRIPGKILCGLFIFIAAYFLAAIGCCFISVNNPGSQPTAPVTIAVISNGVHTDIAVPVKNEIADWSAFIPQQDIKKADSAYRYVSFGWGDKGFYIETPTWADLKASTAFKAMFWMSSSAMHVTWKKNLPAPSSRCVYLQISRKDYSALCSYIRQSFQTVNDKPLYIRVPGYGANDAFYEAKGTYSLFNTCNVWTGNGLKVAGVRVAVWTPFEETVMVQLPENKTE